jgi:hypothetical protein
MTNQEYTDRYHDLTNLVSTRRLSRYYDDDARLLGFVVDVGDAEDKFWIEEFRSYPYKVLDNLNDRLKDDGLATIKYVGSEEGLVRYIAHFGSTEYQNTHEVKLIDVAVETNHGKGYWIIDREYKIYESGLTLTDATEYLKKDIDNLAVALEKPRGGK